MNVAKRYKRQLDLVRPADLDFPITILGAGGLGSWVILSLAKMGAPILRVVDFDKVEEHNIASQFYGPRQVGDLKTVALRDNIYDMVGTRIVFRTEKWQDVLDDNDDAEHYLGEGIIICTVDSMQERADLFERFEEVGWPRLFIDARMGGELLRLFVVANEDSKEYYSSKFDVDKAHEEACTGRSIIYNTFIAGGLLANYVKKFAMKESLKYQLIFDIKNIELI